MRIAESVTFGGSGLDRAGELRGKPDEIARLLGRSDARVLPVWRGKPLFSEEDAVEPGWVAPGHAVLAMAAEAPLFLGLDEAGPRFAMDISAWEPADLPDTLGAFFDPSRQTHPDVPDTMSFAELRGVMALLTPRAAELVASAKALINWHQSHGRCSRCGGESVVAMAGWQRNCSQCKAPHFPRTDPVVIMLITRANAVLLGRSHGWPERMYSLLAGFVEPGETIEAAVRREVFEETGVRVGAVGYLASQPWPFPNSLMFGCRGLAQSDEIRIDPAELDDARWLTREEVADVYAGTSQAITAARRGSIANFLLWNWLADRLD